MQPLIEFEYRVGGEKATEIATYNRMLAWIEEDASSEKDNFLWLVGIHSHHKKLNGEWQIKVEWGSSEVHWESSHPVHRISVMRHACDVTFPKHVGLCNHLGKLFLMLSRGDTICGYTNGSSLANL